MLGGGKSSSHFSSLRIKRMCLIPCLRLHTWFCRHSFSFHLRECLIHSQTILHQTISSSIIALSSHIQTICKLHFCWVMLQGWPQLLPWSTLQGALLAMLQLCFSSCFVGFELRREEPRRRGQSLIVPLEFFKPSCVMQVQGYAPGIQMNDNLALTSRTPQHSWGWGLEEERQGNKSDHK